MPKVGEAPAASEVSAWRVFLEHAGKVWGKAEATLTRPCEPVVPGSLVRRPLLRPKFLHGAYFSNTCAKYSAGSGEAAMMSKIGEAAAVPEVCTRGVCLQDVCKVWGEAEATLTCPSEPTAPDSSRALRRGPARPHNSTLRKTVREPETNRHARPVLVKQQRGAREVPAK